MFHWLNLTGYKKGMNQIDGWNDFRLEREIDIEAFMLINIQKMHKMQRWIDRRMDGAMNG